MRWIAWAASLRMHLCAMAIIFAFIFALPAPLLAQSDDAIVTFTLDFPGSQPEHYSCSVAANGSAIYRSQGKLLPDADSDPFENRFVLTEATYKKIFELAAKAGYFEHKLTYTKGNIAFTGNKTFTYHDSQRDFSQTFNYTALQPAQDLTAIFQNLATTLEFGRRMSFYHSYQKLALDAEMLRLEEMAKSHLAIEMNAIAPILQSIVYDKSVIRIVRERAGRLLRAAAMPVR